MKMPQGNALAHHHPGARTVWTKGSRFATYVVDELIGQGGMARIYRARDERLQRDVALKVLTSGAVPGTEGRARFLREARIAAAIDHPNVVKIFDVGVHDDIPYLVMELLVGADLDARLSAEGALREPVLVELMLPVVAGLLAVHDAGVVHRDLKPGNIFLSRGRDDHVEPKLLDFGISKSDKDGLRLTSAGTPRLIGTPLYMSPEALLGGEMTHLSDQYSIGVILYECATGENPFLAQTLKESTELITTGRHVPAAERPIRPSRRLAYIIERAMSLDPERRFADVSALGRELLDLAERRERIAWGATFDTAPRLAKTGSNERLTRASADRGASADRRARGITSRRPSLLAAAILGWATAAGLVIWYVTQHPSESNPPLTHRPPIEPGSTEVRALRPERAPSQETATTRAPDPAPSLAADAGALQGDAGAARSEQPVPEAPQQLPEWLQRWSRRSGLSAPDASTPGPTHERGTNDAPILD